jgi:large subunit ribosomal protein L18
MANKLFKKRAERVRRRIKCDKVRLCVFISNSHIYAQLINDKESVTIASTSTLILKLKAANIESAKKIGAEIANIAKKNKISEIVFDRGGYLYHGKIKALADAARDNGLKF